MVSFYKMKVQKKNEYEPHPAYETLTHMQNENIRKYLSKVCQICFHLYMTLHRLFHSPSLVVIPYIHLRPQLFHLLPFYLERPYILFSYLLSPYHCIPNKLRISAPIPLKQSLRILY